MYLRLSPYRETLKAVLTALLCNEGIVKLTGLPGTGKSALCEQLFRILNDSHQKVVYLASAPASPADLQTSILAQLGLDHSANFTRTLTDWLMSTAVSRRTLYLIVDDAERMDDTCFLAIRMLCNIQDSKRGLVHILICGSDVLDKKLDAPSCRAFTQFLSQRFSLPPMSREQTGAFCIAWKQTYAAHLELAKKKQQQLFRHCGGYPGALLSLLQQHEAGSLPRSKIFAAGGTVGIAMGRMFRLANGNRTWIVLLTLATLALLAAASGFYRIPAGLWQ